MRLKSLYLGLLENRRNLVEILGFYDRII